MNNFAMKRMQASTMSAFGGVSTFVTVLAGVLLNGEKLYMFHIIGLSLILIRMIGVSYIQIKRSNKK
jgi:drug/metabolite transporter (DMT)-like permease